MYLLGPYQFNVATFTNLFADSLFLRLTVDLFIVLPSGEPSRISTDTRHPNKSIILDLTLPRRYIATSYRVFSTLGLLTRIATAAIGVMRAGHTGCVCLAHCLSSPNTKEYNARNTHSSLLDTADTHIQISQSECNNVFQEAVAEVPESYRIGAVARHYFSTRSRLLPSPPLRWPN